MADVLFALPVGRVSEVKNCEFEHRVFVLGISDAASLRR